uniref:Uncharacterized protein n=1 Tax=viral metagenome TaxID=1070528 RepID=A0A6M3IZR7_9ZZZZ
MAQNRTRDVVSNDKSYANPAHRHFFESLQAWDRRFDDYDTQK